MHLLALHNLRLNLGRLFAIALAIAVNLAVFCAAPWLISADLKKPEPLDSAFLSYIPLHQTQPPQEETEPPPPEPEPPVFKMDPQKPEPLPTPQADIAAPRMEIEFNTALTTGPQLPALPPLPKAAKTVNASSLGAPRPGKLSLDRWPMITARVPPPYPYYARRRGIQGTVMVRLLVGKDGKVHKSEIVKAKPAGVFEDTVLRTVGRWSFSPALKKGRPITAWVETSIKFELK